MPGHQPASFRARAALAVIGKALTAAVLAAVPVAAQNAEISGFISDPSGSVVTGARVVVQSELTGARHAVSSNQYGEYAVPALLPGPYEVTVEAKGFKLLQHNGVALEVGQRARLDFALTIGTATEAITVEGKPSPAQRVGWLGQHCSRQPIH